MYERVKQRFASTTNRWFYSKLLPTCNDIEVDVIGAVDQEYLSGTRGCINMGLGSFKGP